MSALELDKCRYWASFEMPEGYISIKLISPGQIALGYEDKVNSALETKESEKRALDDI